MLQLHDCMTARLRLGHECFFGSLIRILPFRKFKHSALGLIDLSTQLDAADEPDLIHDDP